MKRFIKNIDPCIILVYLLYWLACFCGIIIPSSAVGEKSVADEIISLDVTDQPLGEVLVRISIAANCRFSINESWKNYPITASFDNEPLYRGLILIFRKINNAVIYDTNRTIRIIFYDEGTHSDRTIGHSVEINSSQEPIQQPQLSSDATAPQPEIEDSEDLNDAENVEQQPEEIADSDSEANESGAENTETNEEESSGAAPADKTAALERKQKESGSEKESYQTEETESAFDGLENSEEMESGEESNEN